MGSLLHIAKFRRTSHAVLLVTALATATALWFRTEQSEPSYNGRRLSEWVNLYGNYPAFRSPAMAREPAEAIRHIGTNALPSLLAWIAYEAPPWRTKAAGFVFPSPLAHSRPVSSLISYIEAPHVLAQNAMQAFEALGPIAAPALPELTCRIAATNSAARDRALAALAHIGRPAVPIMAKVLSTETDAQRMWVMFCVQAMGTNARPLLPLLVTNLQHQNIDVAVNSAYELGELKLNPELVVPALTASLNDTRPELRTSACNALSKFGHIAHQALPSLTNALADMDAIVHNSAAEAIQTIAAETLTNARPQ